VVEKEPASHHSPERTKDEVEQRVIDSNKSDKSGSAQAATAAQNERIELPVITIHRILLRHGIVRAQDRYRPAVKRFERGRPNELWQVDFKDPIGWEAPAGPLSVLDDCSRYVVVLQGTRSTRGRACAGALSTAFQGCGVPEAMLIDHRPPWWNMKSVHRSDVADAVADETKGSDCTSMATTSANAGEGKAVSWSDGSRAETAWLSQQGRTATLAGSAQI
jgi:hypothetical protein